MSWNYRVVHHPPSVYSIGDKQFDREEYLAIHEVYYDDDDAPDGVTLDEIMTGDSGSDSLSSLKWALEHMLMALDRPILDMNMKELEQEKQNEFSTSTETQKQIRTEDSPASDGHPAKQQSSSGK